MHSETFLPYCFAFVVYTIIPTVSFIKHLSKHYLPWAGASNRIPKESNIEVIHFRISLLVPIFSVDFWIRKL